MKLARLNPAPDAAEIARTDNIATLCVARLRRLLKQAGEATASHAVATFAPNRPADAKASGPDGGDYDWARSVKTDIGGPLRVAAILTAIFAAFLLFWAAALPLSGAVVANGVFTVEGRNFSIQHPAGGTIEEVLVVEGASVSQGQAIAQLNDVRARSAVESLTGRYIGLRTREASLLAERDDLPDLQFSQDDIELAQVHGAMDQIREAALEYASRRARYASEESILAERLTALEQEKSGIETARNSTQMQLDLINEEVNAKRRLVDRGLLSKSQFNALRRAQADLEGRMGTSLASLGRVGSSVTEAREQLVRIRNQRSEAASTGLGEVRVSLRAVSEELRAARDGLDRTTLRAPADGTIIGLLANATGSVLPSGAPLATLVPRDANAIAEVRVSPADISRIALGDNAVLRLTASTDRNAPEIVGSVSYISADRVSSGRQRLGELDHYLVRVALPDTLPQGVEPRDVSPGIPAEAFLGNERRTLLGYLFGPLTSSFSRAFRER
ncbi:MAG: HlyD family type I secretion periplasmic adaptor subunit [Pseudomonadota bacterium]